MCTPEDVANCEAHGGCPIHGTGSGSCPPGLTICVPMRTKKRKVQVKKCPKCKREQFIADARPRSGDIGELEIQATDKFCVFCGSQLITELEDREFLSYRVQVGEERTYIKCKVCGYCEDTTLLFLGASAHLSKAKYCPNCGIELTADKIEMGKYVI